MARRKREVDYGSSGSWMDTYGDMITLVLTFFVLLFASSNVDEARWSAIVDSVTGRISAIAEPMDPGPANLNDPVLLKPVDENPHETNPPEEQRPNVNEDGNQFNRLYEELKEYIEENNLQESVTTEFQEGMITVSFEDSIFFDTGKADVRPEAVEIIGKLVPFLQGSQEVIDTINVQGHTDNVPISTPRFKNNWWLSYYRAGNVVDYLINNTEIPPDKFSANGFGEYRPIADNDTPEGRMRNRRVQFVIHEMVVVPVPPEEGEPAGA